MNLDFQALTGKHAENLMHKKKKKRKEAQACESGLERYSGWFLIFPPCPLYLDQMAEDGGVRGALICRRCGSFPPSRVFVLLLSHTTIIDSAWFQFS